MEVSFLFLTLRNGLEQLYVVSVGIYGTVVFVF